MSPTLTPVRIWFELSALGWSLLAVVGLLIVIAVWFLVLGISRRAKRTGQSDGR